MNYKRIILIIFILLIIIAFFVFVVIPKVSPQNKSVNPRGYRVIEKYPPVNNIVYEDNEQIQLNFRIDL